MTAASGARLPRNPSVKSSIISSYTFRSAGGFRPDANGRTMFWSGRLPPITTAAFWSLRPPQRGARVGDDPGGAVVEGDKVFVLVEAGRHFQVGLRRPEAAPRVGGVLGERQATSEVPVVVAQRLLEVAGDANGVDLGGWAGREEHTELDPASVDVVADLPGTAACLHVHGPYRPCLPGLVAVQEPGLLAPGSVGGESGGYG